MMELQALSQIAPGQQALSLTHAYEILPSLQVRDPELMRRQIAEEASKRMSLPLDASIAALLLAAQYDADGKPEMAEMERLKSKFLIQQARAQWTPQQAPQQPPGVRPEAGRMSQEPTDEQTAGALGVRAQRGPTRPRNTTMERSAAASAKRGLM